MFKNSNSKIHIENFEFQNSYSKIQIYKIYVKKFKFENSY